LPGIESIEQRFPHITGLGTDKEVLQRLSITYDTRDDLTTPSHGTQWVAYGGLASRGGLLNDSLYSEAGLDGRGFWPLRQDTILAVHLALRYLLHTNDAPFWALSSIGGGRSDIGAEQPLRGFGAGRFTDRHSFSMTVELRHKLLSFDAISTHVDIEVTPFVDAGRVFGRLGTVPFTQLHSVGGIGFRGIARPFVVGYVDVGYGSEGSAVFTGIGYPF
jgi:outer membrane protein assembly factor BamA